MNDSPGANVSPGKSEPIGEIMSETTETATRGVELSDVAAAQIRVVLEGDPRRGLRLRVGAQPGGCSGVSYQLFLDDHVLEGDVLSEFGGVGVVVDPLSARFLDGVTIDYSEVVGQEGFIINSPHVGGLCCG